MPDLGRQPLHRGRDHAERREEHRMAVARNDLRRGGLDGKAELFGDMGFDARIDVRIGADGAGNRAGRDLFPCMHETLAGAGELRVGLREFQTECHRLRVDAMRAADHGREFMFERAAF